MEEVTDEPLYRDRVCGIDIGKAGLVATIRVPSDKDPARRMQETRSFGTTRKEVLALADWLRSWQVPAVVMEATGDYWKGPFYRLEAEGFECVLADAKQVKNLPGRPKRDPADSRWLTACFERGAVTACFVAAPGVPDHPAAHPLPAGPDRRAHPGEAARGKAAGISRDQDLQRPD
jgi:transposase